MNTNLKKTIFSFTISLFIFSLAVTFNACSKDSIGSLKLASTNSNTANNDGQSVDTTPAPPSGGATENKLSTSLLTTEQILQSSLSLTGIPSDNQIMTEYNLRTSLLASTFDLKSVTSPMWIGISNINSIICQKLVAKEVALAAAQRLFFQSIDFTKPASQVTTAAFSTAANAFSNSAYGRPLHSEEESILSAARTEFVSAIAAADVNNTAQTRNLMMYLCVAMISSTEAISL